MNAALDVQVPLHASEQGRCRWSKTDIDIFNVSVGQQQVQLCDANVSGTWLSI